MKNLLSIAGLLSASICFAGSMTSERTGITELKADVVTNKINDQDTTMNKQRRPKHNRKRDMGDTTDSRPERSTDTMNIQNMPADTLPGHAPGHRM